MKIVQITPGAGKMFCGACFRDNALVQALRRMGHSVVMVPLYLPASLEDEDQSAGTPIFFSGINVYLEQKYPLFCKAPRWLRRLFASRLLLGWAARAAARTRADGLGEMTLSMLKGEDGKQAGELEELIVWLKSEKPDVICLSNALLVGLARRLHRELGVPLVCTLQGEDSFLDALPQPYRDQAWETVAERARDIDCFIAPSRYFADLMGRRLCLEPGHLRVIYNGIDLTGFETPAAEAGADGAKTLGYFARMCPEKGLDALVEAYISLKKRDRVKKLKLRVGGYCGPADERFVEALRKRLKANGVLDDVEFCPNLSRSEKLEFLRSLTLFSVPASYSEAFGLYVIEAMACGVPVVQPASSAFPELIEATGGGVLCDPDDSGALANEIEELLLDGKQMRLLGAAGRAAVFKQFSAETMAHQIADLHAEVTS